MEKPFTLIIKEMEEEIIKIINKSNLPAYNIKLSLQNIYNEVDRIDKEEISKYNEYIKNKSNKKESDK